MFFTKHTKITILYLLILLFASALYTYNAQYFSYFKFDLAKIKNFEVGVICFKIESYGE
jgi:hypothetical protein